MKYRKYLKYQRSRVNIIKVLFTFILTLPMLGYAQSQAHKNELNAKITVLIEDTAILRNGIFKIERFEDAINSSYNLQTSLHQGNIQMGQTMIKVGLSNKIEYGIMSYIYDSAKSRVFSNRPFRDNKLFVFEAGDDVQLFIGKESIAFKGKGSDKYNCAIELSKNNMWSEEQNKQLGVICRNQDFLQCKIAFMTLTDSVFAVQSKILESYRSKLNPQVYNLMKADLWADYNTNLINHIFSQTAGGVSSSPNEVAMAPIANDLYQKYSINFNSKYLPDSVLVKSYKYCDFLMWKEYRLQQFYNFNDKSADKPSESLYKFQSIKSKYAGIIRDKTLLLLMLRGRFPKDDANLLFKEALSLIANNIYKVLAM